MLSCRAHFVHSTSLYTFRLVYRSAANAFKACRLAVDNPFGFHLRWNLHRTKRDPPRCVTYTAIDLISCTATSSSHHLPIFTYRTHALFIPDLRLVCLSVCCPCQAFTALSSASEALLTTTSILQQTLLFTPQTTFTIPPLHKQHSSVRLGR